LTTKPPKASFTFGDYQLVFGRSRIEVKNKG
jgi:hypothetical protein